MRRLAFLATAALLAVTALASLGIYWAAQPTILTIAVGPEGGEDFKLVQAMAAHLKRERADVRLRVIPSENPAYSAQMLDQGIADLAVARSDIAMPVQGRTLAILHRNAGIIVAAEGGKIAKPSDLAGKRIGILRFSAANQAMLERILAQYDVLRETVSVVPLNFAAEAARVLKEKTVDAVLLVGPPSGRLVPETITAITKAIGSPVFVAVSEAEAIAQRAPVFEAVEIVRGAFGGNPPRPDDSVTVLGFTHRLTARASLDDDTVAELTRLVFEMRPSLGRESFLANQIAEPDTEKDASLPVHAGAAAYFNDEVPSFMDRYGDWFYILVMLGSVMGSAIAGMAGYASNQSRRRALQALQDLQETTLAARRAQAVEMLDEIDQRLDAMLSLVLTKAATSRADASILTAFHLGLSQARLIVSQRRGELQGLSGYAENQSQALKKVAH